MSTIFERNPARTHAVLAHLVENTEFPYLTEAHRTLVLDEFLRPVAAWGLSPVNFGR